MAVFVCCAGEATTRGMYAQAPISALVFNTVFVLCRTTRLCCTRSSNHTRTNQTLTHALCTSGFGNPWVSLQMCVPSMFRTNSSVAVLTMEDVFCTFCFAGFTKSISLLGHRRLSLPDTHRHPKRPALALGRLFATPRRGRRRPLGRRRLRVCDLLVYAAQ